MQPLMSNTGNQGKFEQNNTENHMWLYNAWFWMSGGWRSTLRDGKEQNDKFCPWEGTSHLGNVEISYDGFLSNCRPSPLYDGILTFSANLLPHHIYRKYSKINCKLSFFSHYKSYMTIWPFPPPPIWRFEQTPSLCVIWYLNVPLTEWMPLCSDIVKVVAWIDDRMMFRHLLAEVTWQLQ